jgi:hypothetical protein
MGIAVWASTRDPMPATRTAATIQCFIAITSPQTLRERLRAINTLAVAAIY